jgi:hypothetical protein
MRTIIFISVFSLGLVSAGCLTGSADGQKPNSDAPMSAAIRVPVIVELFTSEGCSSCPPADRALKFLAEQQPIPNAEIIPLAFHVDYWNNLGWQDKFSSAAFSRRQELYVSRFGIEGSYTPEMVVDGRDEFLGSDTGRAAKVIADAVKDRKGSVTLKLDGDSIIASISSLPEHHPSTVFLAVTEDGITSQVKAGENGGQTFTHTSVVRSLSTLGLIEKDANSFEAKVALPVVADLKRENSRVIVFVQDNLDRKILAVGAAK